MSDKNKNNNKKNKTHRDYVKITTNSCDGAHLAILTLYNDPPPSPPFPLLSFPSPRTGIFANGKADERVNSVRRDLYRRPRGRVCPAFPVARAITRAPRGGRRSPTPAPESPAPAAAPPRTPGPPRAPRGRAGSDARAGGGPGAAPAWLRDGDAVAAPLTCARARAGGPPPSCPGGNPAWRQKSCSRRARGAAGGGGARVRAAAGGETGRGRCARPPRGGRPSRRSSHSLRSRAPPRPSGPSARPRAAAPGAASGGGAPRLTPARPRRPPAELARLPASPAGLGGAPPHPEAQPAPTLPCSPQLPTPGAPGARPKNRQQEVSCQLPVCGPKHVHLQVETKLRKPPEREPSRVFKCSRCDMLASGWMINNDWNSTRGLAEVNIS